MEIRGGGSCEGFFVSLSTDLRLESCQAHRNEGGDSCEGFLVVNSADLSLESCQANRNEGISSECQGFEIQSSSNIALSECEASDNKGKGEAVGIKVGVKDENSSRNVIKRCVTNFNTVTGDPGQGGIGVLFDDEDSILSQVIDCTAIENGTFGFKDNALGQNSFFGNTAEANGGGTLSENFTNINPGVSAPFNIVRYDKANGAYTKPIVEIPLAATPNRWTNINIGITL